MNVKTNALNWFEIPARDIKRAKKFYETIFGIKMDEMEMDGMQMAFFPYKPKSGKASGGIAKSKMHRPGKSGIRLYLNANPDLSKVLRKVKRAGGEIAMPKTSLGPNGFMAFIIDTEGNSVGLHSNK